MNTHESQSGTGLYFYSGTGNSLWVARNLATLLSTGKPDSMIADKGEDLCCSFTSVGLIFPVHIWGLPPPVIDFTSRLPVDPSTYIFAVAVNAGQVAETLIQLKKLLDTRGLMLSCGFSIDLPSNYIPWGGAISIEKQQRKFAAALDKCKSIAEYVNRRKVLPPEKGMFLQNKLFSLIYRKTLKSIGKMDSSFAADQKCTSCRVCEKICPAKNISIHDGKPVWQHRCEQCFACIQWCPQEAIQYGKHTTAKKRYHHPDIRLQDMLEVNNPRP
ncbi:MAG TPA: EFR1 family ferrodoxin [Syntrophorhabdaceae bacterium]|nr:EFR1 family ferrodoxin [Syntrophorhabdaceae bacterium]